MKWILLIFCISGIQICSGSSDDLALRLKSLNGVNSRAVDDLIFIFKKFVPSGDRQDTEMASAVTLSTIAMKDDFYKTNRNISELYQNYTKAVSENKLIQNASWAYYTNQLKSLLEKELTPTQIDTVLKYISLMELNPVLRANIIVSIYHNALGVSKLDGCNIHFTEDFCKKYETCTRIKSVQKVCDVLKARSDINNSTVDELCITSKNLKTFGERDFKWMASFATLMTVSLNEDFWKTNRNISDVRRSVTEGTLEGEVSSESEFLLKLKEMLSRELSLSKTEEALQFATTIFRHGKISDRKEADYVISIFHNALGLPKSTICRIVYMEDCADNCE